MFRLIGDEDHRVRSAVADLLPTFIRSWTTLDDSPTLIRVKELLKNPSLNMRSSFNAIPVTINNLAEAYKDSDYVPSQTKSLSYFVKILFEELIMSRSKFVKVRTKRFLSLPKLSFIVSLDGLYSSLKRFELRFPPSGLFEFLRMRIGWFLRSSQDCDCANDKFRNHARSEHAPSSSSSSGTTFCRYVNCYTFLMRFS